MGVIDEKPDFRLDRRTLLRAGVAGIGMHGLASGGVRAFAQEPPKSKPANLHFDIIICPVGFIGSTEDDSGNQVFYYYGASCPDETDFYGMTYPVFLDDNSLGCGDDDTNCVKDTAFNGHGKTTPGVPGKSFIRSKHRWGMHHMDLSGGKEPTGMHCHAYTKKQFPRDGLGDAKGNGMLPGDYMPVLGTSVKFASKDYPKAVLLPISAQVNVPVLLFLFQVPGTAKLFGFGQEAAFATAPTTSLTDVYQPTNKSDGSVDMLFQYYFQAKESHTGPIFHILTKPKV